MPKYVFISILFILTLVFASTSFAQSLNTEAFQRPRLRSTQSDNSLETRERRENTAQDRAGQRCRAIGDVVDTRITRFEENRQKHIDSYAEIKQRLQNIAQSLSEKGFDVSALQDALEVWDSLVRAYAQSYSAFIEQLKIVQTYTCGDSEGAFRDALILSRELLQDANAKRHDVRKYYVDVIRPLIQDLRDQAKVLKQGGVDEN